MTHRSLFVVYLLVPLLFACSSQEETASAPVQPQAQPPAPVPAPVAPPAVASAPSTPALPAGHPPMTGHPAPTSAQPAVVAGNAGEVTAVHQAGGYTYLQVARGGEQLWLASTPVKFQVGDRVQWGQAAVMRNFTSKALGRTFDQVLFVTQVTAAQPAGAAPAVAANSAKVLSLTQSGGYAFIELDGSAGRQWMAAQQAPVAVGDTVTWNGGMVMRNFTSKSMGRTFDQIIFVGAVGKLN